MTDKRFTEITSTNRIRDNLTDMDYWGLVDSEIIDIMNELHEQNQSVKDILYELKKIDSYWDSAILIEVIERIAVKLGVELDD